MKHLLTAILLLAFAHTAAGERNVSLERDFGTLYGTLLTPDAGTETVAVIIAGSGPTPRNGNVNSYLYLAQALEKAGIASLRYDKRGIGASRFTEPEKMADAVLGDFIGDAAAWADYLAGEGFRRVVLIGHSEGALIAFCAAQQTPKVAAVVSLAGAGYPLDEILQLQLASQLLPDNMDLLLQANAITAALKRGERVESCPPQLEALFHPSVRPARGDPQGAGSDTRRGRGQRPAGATRQCRGAGKGTAPGPEGNHRRDDPPAQKMHGTHAHRPDGSLRRQHATDRPRPRGRRYAIHPGALIFPCRKDKTGLFF